MAVVVTLDGALHDPQAPLLHADDLAAVRGDGIFETLLIRDGRPCLLEAHLERLTHSAQLVDLPAPDLSRWRSAVAIAVDSWLAGGSDEGVLRLVYSRGRESAPEGTSYATIGPVPARVAEVRDRGLAALTLERGLSAAGIDTMPWLLAGAKTLSYAVNMAALRHAERRGAGDVIFVSTDGSHAGGASFDGRHRHRVAGRPHVPADPAAVVSDPSRNHAAGAVRDGTQQGL